MWGVCVPSSKPHARVLRSWNVAREVRLDLGPSGIKSLEQDRHRGGVKIARAFDNASRFHHSRRKSDIASTHGSLTQGEA
jgi:hypothetical protein